MRSARLQIISLVAVLGCATAPVSHVTPVRATGVGPSGGGSGVHPAIGSSGGLSTVHTSGPVSGDGSVGTPVTIANAAITNAKLANPLPSGTGIVKVTSGTASTATSGVDYAMPLPTWDATAVGRAQTAYGTTLQCYFSLTVHDWVAKTSNNGTITYSEKGVAVASTTSAGLSGLATPYQAAGLALIPAPSAGGKFYLQFRLKMATSIDSAGVIKFGLLDGTDALQFVADGSVSTTHWLAQGSHGGTAFKTDTTVAYDTTAYHDMGIGSDGTTYTFSIDGSSVLTSTAIAAGPNAAPYLWAAALNGATAANREVDIARTIVVYPCN